MTAALRPAALALLGLHAIGISQGCATLPRSHDYSFSLTCLVVDDSGRPMAGAEVALELGSVAYQAITPIQEDREITPESGGLVFMYITHASSTPYVLTVRKAGYLDAESRGVQTVQMSGAHLKITLVPHPANVGQVSRAQ